jgi:hypothetical protein
MTFNPNQNGFRQKPDPTKGEMAKEFEQRFQGIMGMIQQLAQDMNKIGQGMNALHKQIPALSSALEMCDYRSFTTVKLLTERGIFTEEEHEKSAEITRIKDFGIMAAKDDLAKGALASPEGYKAQKGDLVTLRLQAFDADTNELVAAISPLRIRFLIGSNRMAIVENELIGTAQGETKVSNVVLGPEYGPDAGKKLRLNMEIFDIKTIPAKVEAPAPSVVPPVEQIIDVPVEEIVEAPVVEPAIVTEVKE